jgi:hypothetical protein
MELVRFESSGRDADHCLACVVSLIATIIVSTAIACAGDAATYIVGVPVAAMFAVACGGYIYGFAMNFKDDIAVRDDAIWWDSSAPRSAGTIPIGEMCEVRILQGCERLEILMRDGTSRSVPCVAVGRNGVGRRLRDIMIANYPDLTVEFFDDAG